jgi:hypothetical protein
MLRAAIFRWWASGKPSSFNLNNDSAAEAG